MSVSLKPQVYYDQAGKPQFVLLSFKEYRLLLEELEDVADLAALEAAVANSTATIKLRDFLNEPDEDE